MILGDGSEVGDLPPTEAPYREVLVSVEDERLRLRGKKFALTTPFSGKGFCFKNYMKGLSRLPLEDAHAVWYDNSNNKKFGVVLRKRLRENFDSYTLIKDTNEPHVVDASCYQYPTIVNRMRGIYTKVIVDSVPDSLPYTLNVEDDVEVPENHGRLWEVMRNYGEAGTVIGHQLSRPLPDWKGTAPIAVNFNVTKRVGGPNKNDPIVDVKWIEEKRSYGVEPIGGGHMGLWLTRTPLVKSIGFDGDADGIIGLDLYWGYKLNLAGHKMLVDWSVKAKHYYAKNGETSYV